MLCLQLLELLQNLCIQINRIIDLLTLGKNMSSAAFGVSRMSKSYGLYMYIPQYDSIMCFLGMTDKEYPDKDVYTRGGPLAAAAVIRSL